MSEQELQVGDEIMTDATYGNGVLLHRITKITEKMYVCQNIRFWKDGLRIVGAGQFGPFKGRIPTKKDRINVRIQKAAMQLNKFVVTEQNVDEVERLLNGD